MEGFEKEGHEGRTMLMTDPESDNCAIGMPALVKMTMRESTTAHGRIKASLVIPTSEPADGEMEVIHLPFAQAVTCGCGRPPHGWTPEFRLEMN
jgi:hypothetical protein